MGENVDKMLHETDQNLDRTEHTLKGMKSIWGGIGNYFKKAPERQPYEKRKTNVEKINVKNKMMEFEKQKAQRGYHKKDNKVKLVEQLMKMMNLMTNWMNYIKAYKE